MNSVSISHLKANPSAIIRQAKDYPVGVENRNKIQAYLIGKSLFEKIIAFMEHREDIRAAKTAHFSKGRNFEELAAELGL